MPFEGDVAAVIQLHPYDGDDDLGVGGTAPEGEPSLRVCDGPAHTPDAGSGQ